MTEPATVADVKGYLWRSGDLYWKLWPQQEPIYVGIRSLPKSVQHAVVLCARQFGKSYLGALLAVEDCLRRPGSTVLVVGPTKEQTVDIVHQSLRNLTDDAPEGLIRRSKAESRWYVGSSELIIGGFDTNNAARKRGRALIKIYIEEVVDSNPDQYVESMRSDLGPALTHSPDAKMIFLTTLPKITDHPFITDTIPLAKLENAFYSYTIDDNKQLSEQQYDACVKRCGGRQTIEFRREYLNEIVRDANMMIVPDFRKAHHVKRIARPEHAKYIIAIDFGGVRDKTVALAICYDFRRNKLQVIAERSFAPNTPTAQIVDGIFAMESSLACGDVVRWADCPGQLQIDLNREHDFQVKLPLKDDWNAAVNNMQLAFTLDEIEVDESCHLLIASLESGQFNAQRTDFGRSVALGHCDAIAALMYGCRMADRGNPYPRLHVDPARAFAPPERVDDMTEVARAIQPIRAAGFKPKRFGSFK